MKPNAPEAARRRIRFLTGFLALSARAAAQTDPLDAYVALGLESRLGLRQKAFSCARRPLPASGAE